MSNGLNSRQTAWIVALSAAGILLRFSLIGRSYWFDELATIVHIDLDGWISVLRATAEDLQPPLYNLSAFAWTRTFGYSELGLRSLSLLFGLLALATPWLARTSLNRNEKLLCFAVLCLMSLPIRYAQEARNYSLLFMMSSVCLFSYYENLIAPTARTRFIQYAGLVLLAFTHLFGLLLAVSFLAISFWNARGIVARIAPVLLAGALAAAVLGPLLGSGAGQFAGGNFWIKFTALTLAKQLLTVLTPVGLGLLVYASIMWRRESPSVFSDRNLLSSLSPFVLAFIGAVVISLHTPILTDRNLIILIPAFALLIAKLLQRHIAHHSATVGLIFLTLLFLQSAVLVWSGLLVIQENFRAIAARSVATGRQVCYVVPKGHGVEWRNIMDFYTATIFLRPDLSSRVLEQQQLPASSPGQFCTLWAEPHPETRESVMKQLPQFSACTDIPLAQGFGRARMASVLLECPQQPP